ncbi:MAG TPA: alpha/beta fold hydrolase [Chitinophagales bacterium]|nr:alpha/beta fold hydrolase [Chitinophagales bacterium]
MPVLKTEEVAVPFWQFNGHLQTIIPNLNRKIEGVDYVRERLDTWDDDFLDLDWSKVGSKQLVIISHGLAGSSDAGYVKSLVKIANEHDWDALAWNNRGCSGTPNNHLFSFHAGKSDDLDWVIRHAHLHHQYEEIFLIGVSMGGNMTLKLLGEWDENIPYPIKGALAISTPLDMYATSLHLIKGWNRIYSDRYLKQYKEMLLLKSPMFDQYNDLNIDEMLSSKNLHIFADKYTAPVFGFKDAEEYLKSQSSMHYLSKIKIPTLLINADNDPFLTPMSFPDELAKKSDYFHFLKTINGGHVGFDDRKSDTYSWVDYRSISFLKSL